MIIITGTVQAKPESLDQLLEASLEHVHRSRTEPGCISHGVHRDVEDDHRLVFVEQWADLDAVRRHFAVPASGAFVNSLATLTTEPPSIEIYAAEPTSVL